ncbi:MAG: hypothetical protein II987_06560 [Clostridia bacterium]|nr:hypothetical protein [Clostridia bacterium]
MGLFKFFSNKKDFVPDFQKREYDNWMDFLEQGGSSKEWEELKRKNKWSFIMDDAEIFSEFQSKFRPLYKEYSESAAKIKIEWTNINNDKVYFGHHIDLFVELCTQNIVVYKNMVALENQYNEDHLQEAEGFKRLAMLYEKQKDFEKVVCICKEAIICGDVRSMSQRLSRAIAKIGREPTAEEKNLIDRNS